MDITEVKVTPIDQDQLKAYVTIVIDQCFVIRDVKVIQGFRGLFVAMPSKKRKNGTFRDIAHPINRETRKMMEKKIMEAYQEATGISFGDKTETGGSRSERDADAEFSGDASDSGEEHVE